MRVAQTSLQRALLAAVAVAALAGLIPTGIVLHRSLALELESKARNDLALAPRVFADREAMSADGLTMHAKELAQTPHLADALVQGNRAQARTALQQAHKPEDGAAIMIGPDGLVWWGDLTAEALKPLIERTRRNEATVATIAVLANGVWLQKVTLAPIRAGSRWVGAAGFAQVLDDKAAAVLSGLTRSDVVLIAALPALPSDSIDHPIHLGASTLDTATTQLLLKALPAEFFGDIGSDSSERVYDVSIGGRRVIAAASPIRGAGVAIFARQVDTELAVLPALRRLAIASSLGTLAVALAVGALLASRLAQPVHQLADAADALARGEFSAPLPRSRVVEVAGLATAFEAMRAALSVRLAELDATNATLASRNAQLTALQVDLVGRERLAAAGRVAAELAHEIRNPIASLRNFLELVRRRVTNDTELLEFTDLAIDELLRMHEMAEQMLDVNRPRNFESARCAPWAVACDVATLLTVGASGSVSAVRCSKMGAGIEDVEATIGSGPLRQVLYNLVNNAREASSTVPPVTPGTTAAIVIGVGSDVMHVVITVTDEGPGIPDEIAPRIFEPFFTTKADKQGVGLGLFVAEGIVRNAGGRLSAANRTDGRRGAVFTLELPRAVLKSPEQPAPVGPRTA